LYWDRVCLSLGVLSAHRSGTDQVAVEVLYLKVGQTGTNEVILMEYCDVLNNVVKLSQKSVLNEFGLQKASFVDRTVEKA